eukprot:801115-Pleurochrysis_carterae.AAC.3
MRRAGPRWRGALATAYHWCETNTAAPVLINSEYLREGPGRTDGQEGVILSEGSDHCVSRTATWEDIFHNKY